MTQFALLDDDAVFRRMMSRAFGKLGVDLVHAGDLESLTLQAEAAPPSVVLVDLAMPDPQGVHWRFGGLLNVRLARRRFGPGPQIWVLTGYDDTCIERECLRNGADHVIFKSMSVDDTAYDVFCAWKAETQPRRASGARTQDHEGLTAPT
ncbi:MAG: response regulator [Pseudomonadota bacterium]